MSTIAAARRECSRPGPRLAQLVERAFDPMAFGKDVIPGWGELTQDQRNAFAAAADTVVGSEERPGYVQELCAHKQKIIWVEKLGAEAITRVRTTFATPGGTSQAELWFRDDGDRWTFIGSWFGGVDVFILTWRERLAGGYEVAMKKLRDRAR